jgi:hypothetical protein
MSSKIIFKGTEIINGILWNKTSFQQEQVNQEILPKFLYIHHEYFRMDKFADIYCKSISERRTHPWQEKRKGFLIASKYQNGKYYHILKQIVFFL